MYIEVCLTTPLEASKETVMIFKTVLESVNDDFEETPINIFL